MSELALTQTTLTNLESDPSQKLGVQDATLLPALIAATGEKAQYKFVEFFTARLSSENTRKTYGRAAYRFLGWCEAQDWSWSISLDT